MSSPEDYSENVQEILAEYGDMLIFNPNDTSQPPISLAEAVPLCVKGGENHLLKMLSGMSLEEAGIVLQDFAPKE